MRHVVTKKDGRISFGRVEWTVYRVGEATPIESGVHLRADRYYQDRDRMPLWIYGDAEKHNPIAYANRFTSHSPCGKFFTRPTQAEANSDVIAHLKQCAECAESRD